MKKTTMKLILGFILFIALKVNAQECEGYFLDQKGKAVETTFYNAKDKEVSRTISEVVDIQSKGEETVFNMKATTTSPDLDEPIETQFDLICEGGNFHIDMSDVLDPAMLNAYQSMEVDMKSENLSFSKNMNVGDLLSPAKITITVSNAGIKIMTMTVEILDRKVESSEKITTPAGTFDCLLITYTMKTNAGIIKSESMNKEWYAKDIGTVKSETYNKKMKLESWSQITGIQ